MSNNHLKDYREDNDYSQKDFAEILQIEQSAYGKYERGVNMMGIDKYKKLAVHFNISLDYLTGLVETPKPLKRKKEEKLKIEKINTSYEKAPDNIKKAIDMLLNITD